MRAPILSAFLALVTSTFAGNWPAWRGPNGDGTTPETDLPLKFSPTEGVKWKIELPERGNSTPVVWGQKIFLTQNVGTKRTLMCLDRKDGKTLWQAGPEWTEKEVTHGTNPYCSASAATDGERVVAWFGSAGCGAGRSMERSSGMWISASRATFGAGPRRLCCTAICAS